MIKNIRLHCIFVFVVTESKRILMLAISYNKVKENAFDQA